MNKEQFLQKLRDEQIEWEAFLTSIPVAQREQAGLYGTWSVKDVIGHVVAWERYMTGAIRAHLRNAAAPPHELWGEFAPPDELEDDDLNNWMAAQINLRSFGEALGMQREVRMQLIGTVQAMSEALLTTIGARVAGLSYHPDDPFWQVIASMSYNHIRDHRSGLQTVLASLPASSTDAELAIRTLHQQFLGHWNRRDATAIAALYSADANVVGFDGSQMNGRAEIAATLADIFAHHQTAAYAGKVREVRLLNENTALLRAVVGMIPPGGSDINSAVNAIQSLVAVKQAGAWQIALFHNTPAQFHGRPELSAALTAELRQLIKSE